MWAKNLGQFILQGSVYISTPCAEIKWKGKVFPFHAIKACKEVEV